MVVNIIAGNVVHIISSLVFSFIFRQYIMCVVVFISNHSININIVVRMNIV